ncbi:MAG TPA: ankyrin repeat domain-containing protein [Ramlibacter sp.]|nr:ankyrin repeat domain-containing protein [Ramlibacter sp.]
MAIVVVTAGFSFANAGSYDDFFIALKQDRADTVRALLQRGFEPNTPSPDGLDALYVALRDGSLKSAQVLIDWPKTDVDKRTPKDETPLMMASIRGQAEIARKLLARGADVNKTGWTPLHYAATSGHVDIMKMLLDQNAYIDAESPNGSTPLMMAAMYGPAQAVKFLVDAGADPAVRNHLGMAAADFASAVGRQDVAKSLAIAAQAFDQRYRKPATRP